MIKKNLSSLSIILIGVMCTWNVLNTQWWNYIGVMAFDVACYYGYLPQYFNHKTDSLTVDEIKLPALAPPNKYVVAPNGNKVLKTTMGMAFLYSPFYAAGYLLHYLHYGNGGSGMEIEYRKCMAFFGIFCLLFALMLLRRQLKKYFQEPVVALTLLVLVFGTNALYYTTYEGCMTHIPDLLLFLLFLRLTENWYSKPSVINSLFIGLLLGLMTLIRPTNILIGILFILYDITSFKQLKDRVAMLLTRWPLLLTMAAIAPILWIPQIIYWHRVSGNYFFFSYVGERFFFLDPRIWSGFFSFRKGWLIYTPVGWLMLIGFVPMYRYAKNLFWGYLIFYITMVYIIFSWWSWWYGGSFSCRPMVEMYAVLALPLACILQFAADRLLPFKRVAFGVLLIALSALNIFQTYQYSHQIIHWDRMSYAAYKNIWFSVEAPPDSLLAPAPSRRD